MCRLILALVLGLGISSCSPAQTDKAASPAGATQAKTINALNMLDPAKARSCWSDAECGPDQNCECPLSSENGNCEHPGICVPRDKAAATQVTDKAREASAANAALAITDCRSMRNLSFIPAGYHPVTAQWALDAQGQINDTVCIAKTNSPQIRVLRWLDFPLPAGYHTLRVESGIDTTFRGCRQWSEWQGQRQCIASFDLYVMQKDS